MKPFLPLAAIAALALAACSSSSDAPPLAGTTGGSESAAQAIYQEARAADNSGKADKAIKLYDKLADKYPWTADAAQARFRQAELLEQKGETTDAFDAYQSLIERHRDSSLYSQALSRQAAVAQAAADGEIKTSFLGLKSRLPTEKIVEMLEKIRANAPASPTASRAQFSIAELHESRARSKQDLDKSIAAYRKLVQDYPDSIEAPEAQYRIGTLLVKQAERGNQDQANINRAREAFLEHLDRYPGHGKNDEARAELSKLAGRDLQRSFDTGEFYFRKGDFNSARFYYQDVAKQTKSGPLHDKAQARLQELSNR